jgi:hypothetical protein
MNGWIDLRTWGDSRQVYSTGKLHPIEGGMTQTHRKLYDNTSNVATDLLGWLGPIDVVYSSSRPSLYFSCVAHFRFRPVSACTRPGGAVDAGSCQARSCSEEETRAGAALGARSGPVRRR